VNQSHDSQCQRPVTRPKAGYPKACSVAPFPKESKSACARCPLRQNGLHPSSRTPGQRAPINSRWKKLTRKLQQHGVSAASAPDDDSGCYRHQRFGFSIVTLWTKDLHYNPLGVQRPCFGLSCSCTLKNASSRGRGNVVIPKGFPKSVGRVGSRLHGFPCFPQSGISTACCSCAS